MFRVTYLLEGEIFTRKRFRSHSSAMFAAKTWVNSPGKQAVVAIQGTNFAWFNSPVKLK